MRAEAGSLCTLHRRCLCCALRPAARRVLLWHGCWRGCRRGACLGAPTRPPQLCNLRHPNVVTFYGCCVRKGKGILLTELCEGERARGGLHWRPGRALPPTMPRRRRLPLLPLPPAPRPACSL